MILIKVHESYRTIVAVCDSDLIGKHFVEGNLQLDLKESFYGGKGYEEDKAIEVMRNAAYDDATFNIVGKESVNAAVKAGIIEDSKGAVIKIRGIPHAMSLC